MALTIRCSQLRLFCVPWIRNTDEQLWHGCTLFSKRRESGSVCGETKLQHRLQHRNILFYLTHALCAPTPILSHSRPKSHPCAKTKDCWQQYLQPYLCRDSALTNWSRLVPISRMHSCKYQRVNAWVIGGEQYPQSPLEGGASVSWSYTVTRRKDGWLSQFVTLKKEPSCCFKAAFLK